MTDRTKQSARYGQSATEYGMAIAMVSVVCLGALWYFGGTLLSDMVGIRTTMQGNGQDTLIAGAAPPAGDPQGDGTDLSSGALLRPAYPGAPTLTATLANGQTISLPGYPDDLSKLTETAGSNGATEAILAQLESLIAQMEASGSPPESVNRLKELAAQGYKMAAVQKILEDTVNASDPYTTSHGQLIDFNGKSYSFVDLAATIGYADWPQAISNPLGLENPFTTDSELRTFLSLYSDAVDSGALSDPAVADIVRDATTKVAILGESTEHVMNVMHGQVDEKAYFRETMPGTTTIIKSDTICRAGSLTVSCKD